MYFVLDIVCVAVVIACIIRFAKGSFWSPLTRVFAVAVSVLLALVVQTFLAPVIANNLVIPFMEKQAAFELADVVGGQHLDTAEETAKNIDTNNLEKLIKEHQTFFEELVDKYNCSVETIEKEYKSSHDAYCVVQKMADPPALLVSKAVVYCLALIVCMLLLKLFVIRRIEGNLISTRRTKTIKNMGAPICGAILGIIIVFALTIAVEWFVRALCGVSVLLSKDMITKGLIYPYLRVINPLYMLASIMP